MPTLAVCQLYHPLIHGDDNSANGHHLALHTYDDECDESPYAFFDYWTSQGTPDERAAQESSFRDMKEKLCSNDACVANVRETSKLPCVDIVETVELDSGHMVAIKKTLWLSIFQRMLKNRYSEQKQNQRIQRQSKRARRD
jgi:hypothetical protein